jgi:UDP-glucose 4-epimerase
VNILITGVAGLIGSRLADYFTETTDDTIIGIDDLSGGYIENINPKVIFYQKDLSNADISEIFDKHKIDVVYHFACYAAEGLSPFMRRFNYSNNVLSTVNIINACINYKVGRLVYASSMSVYGHGKMNGEIFDENDPLAPIDPYGISKMACELDIKVAGEQHGLDWVIVRPHNVMGIKQNIWDKYRNVLGIWMYQTLNDEPMLIYGDGEQTRAFTYIDNILPCLYKCGFDKNVSHEVINLGGTKMYTINEACKILSGITGYDKVQHMEARHEVKFAVPTYQKSIDLLEYKEDISFEEGLKRMWEWAKVQPMRKRMVWDTYEITDKLYKYWRDDKH